MQSKWILATGALIAASSAHAANPWSSLQGCYVTEQRNGAPVDPGQANLYTNMIQPENTELGMVTDTNGNPIPGLSFYIFQKFSTPDNTAYYDYKAAFDSLGTYSSDASGMHFRYDGGLLYKSDGEAYPFTLHESIDVRAVDGERLALHTVESVPQVADGSVNSDDTYVIRRIACSNNATPPNPGEVFIRSLLPGF